MEDVRDVELNRAKAHHQSFGDLVDLDDERLKLADALFGKLAAVDPARITFIQRNVSDAIAEFKVVTSR